jgi:hypothetical protein
VTLLASRGTVSLGAALGAFGLAGSTVLTSGPAAAEPPLPPDVQIQCTAFYGQIATWPHPIEGCTVRGEKEPVSGFSSKNPPEVETLFWNAPFLGGASMLLTEIGSGPPAPNTSCPPDHPGRVGIFATISATEPGTKQYDGSRIIATICADQDDFFLADGSQFTFYRK